MVGFSIHREETAETVTLRLEGNFNRHGALELLARLPVADPRMLVIDFSRVREFPDLAVPALSRSLESRKVRLRGLASHQTRMFGYFGVGQALTERSYYTPEELMAV